MNGQKQATSMAEICQKEVLTTDETALYMGVSKHYLYRLTMSKTIPHYKPMGKICFFNRKEVERWMQSKKVEVANSPQMRDANFPE